MASRRRLDAELVRRGLVPSREAARRAVEQGRVVVDGAPAAKVTRLVAPHEQLRVLGPPPRFVGRGGHKLEGALEAFGVDVAGRRALDAGSSTGGFTDALLQAGAREVVAVDVGRAQLHERLRADPRVVVRERTDVRSLPLPDARSAFAVVVADLSFISLRAVSAALLRAAEPGADLVLLVKPQFEAGRSEASRGRGVIRDPAVWRTALLAVEEDLRAQGADVAGWTVSPLRGADGNVEFFVHARAPGGSAPPATPPRPGVDDVVRIAVDRDRVSP